MAISTVPALSLAEILDQSNDPPWRGGAVNVVPANTVSQGFVPTMPVLTAVEVAIVTGNKRRGGDLLTLQILDSDGREWSSSSSVVSEGFAGWQRFTLPGDGIRVTPGHRFTLRLQDTGKNVFWWKYASGNPYPAARAMFHGAQFSDNDFYFRSFGAPGCGQQTWCTKLNRCVPRCDEGKCEALSADGTSCFARCGSGWTCRAGKCCKDIGRDLETCQNTMTNDPCQ